jgi:YidC/Oxa1 family membrane protein insertase
MMDQDEKKNLLIVFILATLIFVGWSYFFEQPKKVTTPSLLSENSSQVELQPKQLSTDPYLRKEQALIQTPRIQIETPELKGTIDLRGAKIDHLVLKNYHLTVDPDSPHIELLTPQGTQHAYYSQFGWVSENKGIELPDDSTVWTSTSLTLTPTNPVTLRTRNRQGVIFEQIISVDDKYLFTVRQKIINTSSQELPVQCYGSILRQGTPQTQGFFILHEGPLGFLNNKLVEVSYKDLKKSPALQESRGGWLGVTDKYWLTALIPDQKEMLKTSFRETGGEGHEHYQANFVTSSHKVNPGQEYAYTSHFFAGAKVLELLDQYEEKLGVKHFDLAVDFGWFYFLTKPIFYMLTWTHKWLGNFGLAIMLLTILLKIAFFPLANKSYRSMGRMKKLQPELEKIRARYNDDKLRMNQEIMELYKREKVNPMAGCLPMFIQIPVFFALYKVLFVSIEMRHAPFYGWIHDLSSPDPTTIFNLFGLLPWSPPSFLMLGAWPLLMGITMFLQQKLNPPPADPVQEKVFMLMPLLFTYMLASFPAGLVIYWTWNNILTIIQQWTMMRLASQDTKVKVLKPYKYKKK